MANAERNGLRRTRATNHEKTAGTNVFSLPLGTILRSRQGSMRGCRIGWNPTTSSEAGGRGSEGEDAVGKEVLDEVWSASVVSRKDVSMRACEDCGPFGRLDWF